MCAHNSSQDVSCEVDNNRHSNYECIKSFTEVGDNKCFITNI